jgi:Zn-dependent membrane protease YugP
MNRIRLIFYVWALSVAAMLISSASITGLIGCIVVIISTRPIFRLICIESEFNGAQKVLKILHSNLTSEAHDATSPRH